MRNILTRGPWALTLCLRTSLAICQISTYTPFPAGQNRAYFSSTGSSYRDMGRFSKLPYLGIKCQKLHIHPLSTPRGRNWACFSSTGSGFRDTGYFENCHIWVWNLTWPLAKVPDVAHMTSSYPQGGQNWANFCSTGSGFRDTGYFQNCHIWAWNLAIFQSARFCTYTVFLPQIQLVLALRAAVSEIQADFQNCHIWVWNLAIGKKCQKLHIFSLSTPRGRNWAYFYSTDSGFRDIGWFSKLPYLGLKFGHWPKCQVLHIYPLSTPNSACFSSTGSSFRDTGWFSKLPYLGMKLGHWPKFQKLYIYFLNYSRLPNFTPLCSTADHFQHIGNFAFSHWAQC